MRKLLALIAVAAVVFAATGNDKRYQVFGVAFYNLENFFDTINNNGKYDYEYTENGSKKWDGEKYRNKVHNMAYAISQMTTKATPMGPAIIGVSEIENITPLQDLVKDPALKDLRLQIVHHDSPDLRGIDVALLYHEFSFAPIAHASLRVAPVRGMRPTRDILYVAGRVITDDTLHIFVVHAPSRRGGERATRRHRLAVAGRLCEAIDSVRTVQPGASIIVAGDFNDYAADSALAYIGRHGMVNVTARARGSHGAKATYRYDGKWGSLDHVFLSDSLMPRFESSRVNDLPFLTEPDDTYGGVKPRRTYVGYRYRRDGYSDHLPLVVRLRLR